MENSAPVTRNVFDNWVTNEKVLQIAETKVAVNSFDEIIVNRTNNKSNK